MANSQSAIQSRLKLWGAIIVAVLLAVWLGVPAFNKWRADRLVDELCAKDGGIKVYETVTPPAERFSKFGEIYVPLLKDAKLTDEFYYVGETQWIVGDGKKNIGDLDLYRYHDKLFRASDKKLLAEGIGYTRRGGDPIGPWHPSSYTCPPLSGASIKHVNQRVFVRNK